MAIFVVGTGAGLGTGLGAGVGVCGVRECDAYGVGGAVDAVVEVLLPFPSSGENISSGVATICPKQGLGFIKMIV